MAQGKDATKDAERPSHEALEETGSESAHSELDKSAMQSAKRAQNEIKNDEQTTPDSTQFNNI